MKKKKITEVHIGDDIWRCGEINTQFKVENKKTSHLVIYGPNKKLYHLYGNEINLLFDLSDEYYSSKYLYYSGSKIIHEKLKIYILTSILDERKNWCFDLKCLPQKGKLKIIYNNGTIKNVDFDGEKFEPVEIKKLFYFLTKTSNTGYKKVIKPVAYRII